VPEDRHYAVLSVGAPSWGNYSLGSYWDAATGAVLWQAGTVVLFKAFLVAITTTTKTSWGLLAVDPDAAEPLAVALCEVGLSFVFRPF